MKAILSFVATVALIATIRADLAEYSDVDLEEMELYKPNSRAIPARIMNANVKRTFESMTEVEDNTRSLFTEHVPNQRGENYPVCGNVIGILVGKYFFCDIDIVQVRAANIRTNTHVITMWLRFAPDAKSPFVVEVPFFKAPAQFASADQEEEFKVWAASKEVATCSPFNEQQIEDILEGKDITSDFRWLKEILSKGIYKSSSSITMQDGDKEIQALAYATRPVVLRTDKAKKLFDLVDWSRAEASTV